MEYIERITVESTVVERGYAFDKLRRILEGSVCDLQTHCVAGQAQNCFSLTASNYMKV